MKKKLIIVLIALGFFSLSRGLWYNFQSLWLEENGLSLATISTVTSLSSLACVSFMLLLFNYITKDRIKRFLSVLLILKVVILVSLFFLNQSALYLPIKLLIMADIIVDTEITISIYPFLTLFEKSDTLYCKKDLIYSSFNDIGILFGAIFLGKQIRQIEFTFNIFLLLSIFCALIAFFLIESIKVPGKHERHVKKDVFSYLFRSIRKDKISQSYLSFIFFGNISYYLVTGLKVLLLTNMLAFSPNKASFYLLIISLASDLLGVLVLKKLTFKNNKINIFIKFGGRLCFYVAAILFNHWIGYLVALSYALLLANSYSHITDAPYINRYDSDYQLGFCNLRNIANYTSQAIGIAICGLAFKLGLQFLFLVAAIFIAIQIFFALRANKLRMEDTKEPTNA